MMFEHDTMGTAVINTDLHEFVGNLFENTIIYNMIKTITDISHPGYAGMAGCDTAARTALYTGRPRPLRWAPRNAAAAAAAAAVVAAAAEG